MDANLKEAVRLLGIYTAGRFDIWALTGSTKASVRAHVMSALNGVKTPQSQSGVYALRDAFNKRAEITGNCISARESNFIEFCRAA